MGLIKQTQQPINQQDIPGDWKGSLLKDVPTVSSGNTYVPMNKDRRILVQGILQAVVQSQGLLLEPGGTWEEKVEQATLRFVKFVEDNSR